jgi:hypothetical protein
VYHLALNVHSIHWNFSFHLVGDRFAVFLQAFNRDQRMCFLSVKKALYQSCELLFAVITMNLLVVHDRTSIFKVGWTWFPQIILGCSVVHQTSDLVESQSTFSLLSSFWNIWNLLVCYDSTSSSWKLSKYLHVSLLYNVSASLENKRKVFKVLRMFQLIQHLKNENLPDWAKRAFETVCSV